MSVAIRAITRLQDADDVNVSLGVGVDEYALVYDHDTARFLLRAPAAPFAGILATGATVGATSQAQAFTVGISLADTTTSTTGVVYKNTDRFIHNFHHPTGQTAVPVGRNTFVGINAGNFTLGSTATATNHGSDNVAIGEESLKSLTTGNCNVAIGALAAKGMSSSTDNVCIGFIAGSGMTGSRNFALGTQALQSASGSDNAGIGYRSLVLNTSGIGNIAIGRASLENATTGSYNIAIGNNAGKVQANGVTALTDPENSVYIGAESRGNDNADSNSIVIGYASIGLGANTTVIGNTSTASATIYGAGAFPLLSTVTNAVSNVLTLTHDTSGTAAAGFGAGQLFQLESSTTAAQDAARIQALWYEATHATRKADLVLTAYDTAEREGLRIRGAGSAAAIGFLGATPAARVAHVADPTGGGTVDAEARSAINSILATLETFGFHATS